MKFRDWFIINKRVLILIIIGLVLEEMLVSSLIAARFSHPETQKLPAYDEASLTLWVEQIEKAKGYKVVVLGDSVVHGDDVADTDTLPIYISREFELLCPNKQIKVFNMGMAGASPAEVYFLLNGLEEAGADLFIYDINLGWFSRKETLEHQSVLHLNNSLNEQELLSLGIEPLKTLASPAEEWLEDHLFSHWNFLQYRLLLNYWLFGQPLRQQLEEALENSVILGLGAEDRGDDEVEMRAPWKEKDWEGQLDPAGGRVGDVYLSEHNAQWILYQRLTERVKSNKLSMIFFVTPRNYELLDRYDMVDRKAYQDNLSVVIKEAEDNGIPVLNYDNAIPNHLFVDTIHPLAEGNQILAHILVEDIIDQELVKR
ncbi:hypothetical protein ASZ90_018530 [hydrocarbon metagenome]|uniref:Uncharacterized protein n=1 Tax=hydrocarbon metagenome TaxID=938273 RepID=A0A0W8E617_9ZZZZ